MDSSTFQDKYKANKFSQMYGLEYLEKQFSSIYRKNNYGVFLFSGLNGHGKTTLAEIFLKRYFCLNPQGLDACLQCVNCNAITNREGFYSDVDWIKGTSLNNESLERIKASCYYVPSQLPRKVIFIDDFDLAEKSIREITIALIDEYKRYALLIFTVTTLADLPVPLVQRSKVIPLIKPSPAALTKLIRDVCDHEEIEIQSQESVIRLIGLSDQTPRIILTVLDIIKDELEILSEESLESPIVQHNLQLLTGKYY